MPDSFEAGDAKPGYKGPVNSEGKMVYGKRNPEEVITQRQHRLYLRQMDGLTPRQLVYEHASRESVALTTAWRDWKAVQAWNETDFAGERAEMVSRLTAARWRLFNKSFSKGHYQTAASVLDGLSKTCGDGTEFSTAEEVKLNISIEPQAEKSP
jgi:heme-degrading monooxygenase HmoA